MHIENKPSRIDLAFQKQKKKNNTKTAQNSIWMAMMCVYRSLFPIAITLKMMCNIPIQMKFL